MVRRSSPVFLLVIRNQPSSWSVLLRGRRLGGNREREAAALSRRALEPDTAAMLLHQRLRNRETQPRAFAYTSRRFAGLVELVEDQVVVILGDTDPGVADRDFSEASARCCYDQD